ncbi:MAG: hypothetical protein U9N56_03180 [Actinomycetota bacterium]|nr:hypothetical protein [Actinomycetota bacterium]
MRKKLTAVILAVLVFSLIAASAASLGGINTADLGADSTIVASCDTADGVDVDYTFSYDTTLDPGYFAVSAVVVSSVDATCDGYNIYVEIGSAAANLDSGSTTVLTGGTTSVPMTLGTADAKAVEDIAIVISG